MTKPKVMNISSKYAIYILPLLLILLLACTASALPTVAHDKVQGEMYVSSTANWESKYSTNNFDVPNGTVVFARYYVGVWASSATTTSISTIFNGNAFATNPSCYSSGMGVTWIPYDVTDYVVPGEINTATINSASWGDGRQYGTTLVVVLKNENKSQIEYWIADGLDWLHYGDYVGDEVDNSFTYFNGTVDLADVQSANLYSTHLTGYNYEDFNGYSLSDPADSVSGDYFNYIRWDNVKASLVAENQTVNVGRGGDAYCSPVFHALSIAYKIPDLVPVSLTPVTVVPNTVNTMTATIENQGNKDSTSFNVSLLVDGIVVDTQTVTSLESENSTNVDFHWTLDGTANSYTLTVNVDPENAVNEGNESNNTLTALVGTTTAPIPVADFTATPTAGEVPLTVNFTDQSANSPLSWTWDFNNDGTMDSIMQNPTYTYDTPGNYTVKLTVSNGGGNDEEVKTDYIFVNYKRPIVNFTANLTKGNAPLTVQFNDTSLNSPTVWYWDFGDNTISTEQNPVHTYTAAGNYTVNLTVTNAGGSNSSIKTEYITVGSGVPIANFTANTVSGYTPLEIRFFDTSTINPTSWAWDFGDNTTSTEQNPVHTYISPGLYTVNFTVSNDYGSDIKTKANYIYAGKCKFSQNISFSAGGQAIYQQDIMIHRTSGTAYEENAGGLKIWHVYLGDSCREDYGDLRFTDATGTQLTYYLWPDYTSEEARFCVRLERADQPGRLTICYGDPGATTTSNGNATYFLFDQFDGTALDTTKWEPVQDNGISVSSGGLHISSGTGNFAEIFSRTAVPSGIILQFRIQSKTYSTSLGFGNRDYTDNGSSIGLESFSSSYNSAIYSGEAYSNLRWAPPRTWTSKSTDGDIIPDTPGGYYTEELVISPDEPLKERRDGEAWTNSTRYVGVSGTKPIQIEHYRKYGKMDLDYILARAYSSTPPSALGLGPIANFTVNMTNGNAPFTVHFTDSSKNSPATWIWDFGDNTTSTEQNPVHTYVVAGNYTVNLTVTNSYGSDTGVKTDYISVGSGVPVANFTTNKTGGNAPLTVKFTDTSTINPATWIWDFGDNTTSTEQNPVHTYVVAGNYTVNLTATNSYGSNTCVKIGYITVGSGVPVANFTANVTGGYAPLTVQFNDTSTVNPASWSWDFGDGNTSTEQHPVHTYMSAGTYTISLTVTNTYGSGTETKVDHIYAGMYEYNQQISYSASDRAVYQQDIVVHRSNGTAYEENADGLKVWHVYLGDNCRDDYGDVRFTDVTGAKLAYYLWPDYTSEQARFCVRIENTDQPGTLTICYGNPGITTTSNGNATYFLFDQFDGTVLDTTKWELVQNNGISVSSGGLHISSGTGNFAEIFSRTTVPSGIILQFRIQSKTYSTSVGFGNRDYTDNGSSIGLENYDSSYNSAIYSGEAYSNLRWAPPRTWSSKSTDGDIIPDTPDGYYTEELVISPDEPLKERRDGGTWTNSTRYVGVSGTKPIQIAHYRKYGKMDLDYILARAYSTTPLFASAFSGEQQTAAPPVASFTATPIYGFPHTIQFTDKSFNFPTEWTWDFGDGTTSPEQNPVHTYAADGNYTITLTATNEYGTDTETKDYEVVTLFAASLTVSPSSVQLNQSETQYFTAVAVDQLGNVISNTSINWSSSNETIGTIDSNGLFTANVPGKVNITASAEGVTGLAEVTVMKASPDFIVSVVTSPMYPISHNTVTATIENHGSEDASEVTANVTIAGNTTTITVPALAIGSSTTISVKDTARWHVGDLVPITVVVDPGNEIDEANETNNVYTKNATISATSQRYNGGRFSDGYDKVNNLFYAEGNVGVAVAISGNYGSQYGVSGVTLTRKFSADDLDIPAGATIKSARLYQGSTWYGDPGFNLQFNGHETQEADAKYGDCINGQYAFDVTTYLNTTGDNIAVLTSTNSLNKYAYYATVLIVVYEADSEPYRQIWVNEGSDCLLADYGADLAWGYTMFDNVSTDSLFSARTITVLESDDGDVNSINFNGESLPTIKTGGSDPTIKYFSVTDALQGGENELGVTGPSYFNFANAVLEVTQVTASEANFTANVTSGNAPLNVEFTDTSTGTPTSWTWDFGDGKNSTEQNPTHTYTAEGTYTVKLTVSNSFGSDSEEKTGYITAGSVVLAPVANFSVDQTTGTAPLSVQFTDESTNTPTSWTWEFGDGKTSTEQNPTHTYETIGTYTVKLTATNYGGSNFTIKTDYITVTSNVSAPVASFTFDENSGRVPFTVQFTDTTTGSVSSWNWDFGDGGTSNEQNPTHTYVTEGSYNVTLTATGPGGSNTITSTEPVVVSAPLTSDSYNGGIPLTNVQNGTVSGDLWYDSYYAMETSAQKAFTLPSYTDIKWARLYVDVYDGHMENNYRGNVEISIDADGDSTYELQKNETFNTTYSFPGEGGTGPVWLSDHLNRVTSDYQMWYDLTGEISGQTVNVQAITSKIDSNFDGRVKAMTLVVAYDDGDSDEVYYWVNQGHDTVNPLDTEYTGSTSFGTSTLASGWSSANLTAIYLASVDGIYSFQGTTLTSGTPQGSYYGDNTWDVSSMLTAGEYSIFTYNKQEEKYYKIPLALMSVKYAGSGPTAPTAGFSANVTEGEVPLTVLFSDESTGSPTAWVWDFGDNETSSEQSPVHTYSAAGNYTVTLTVTNAAGSDSEVKTDYIIVSESSMPEEPVAAFNANVTEGEVPLTVQFSDESTGSPTSWFWDFGDGANSTEQNPSHTYPSAGNYTVNLTVENAAGSDFELKSDYIEVSDASGSTVTLYFDPTSSSVAENESTEISIVASNFPAGLSGYNLTVAIDDPAVAEIIDIEYPTWALITENSTLPGTSIYMKTIDLEDSVKEGAADVVLATLTVSGKESGSANLSIGVKRLEDDSGDSIEPALLAGTIEVTLLSPLPDQEYAPKDLDGDGLYEDLTGNGEFSFVDIVAYFHNMDWIEENMPVEYFDFNGNGRIDFDDVVDMFGMI
ncbi:DUF2341 domain-containing protein [Methanosarcina acetivorans]|uniref:DUF2341 domain-containing protein n=1 Tax=Methanosarcina acetivorans TaxID=2214 RepID=UPI0024798FB7|nr:DUF2341 domain-containing protein [Methanosarcina acetivorans]